MSNINLYPSRNGRNKVNVTYSYNPLLDDVTTDYESRSTCPRFCCGWLDQVLCKSTLQLPVTRHWCKLLITFSYLASKFVQRSRICNLQSGECPRTKRDRGELAWDRYRYHYPECSNYSGRVMGRISEHSLDISCWSLRSVRWDTTAVSG